MDENTLCFQEALFLTLPIVKLHGEEKRIINLSESLLNYTLPFPSKRKLKEDDGKRKRLTVQYFRRRREDDRRRQSFV